MARLPFTNLGIFETPESDVSTWVIANYLIIRPSKKYRYIAGGKPSEIAAQGKAKPTPWVKSDP